MSAKPKILFWDLETSYMVVHTFGLFNQNISYDNIIEDSYIICGAWAGEKGKAKCVSVLDDKQRFKEDNKDDYYVVKQLRDEIEAADIIVAHNGDKFDWKAPHVRAYHPNLVDLIHRVGWITFLFTSTQATLFIAVRRSFRARGGFYLGAHRP